jgi:hypothetical protein
MTKAKRMLVKSPANINRPLLRASSSDTVLTEGQDNSKDLDVFEADFSGSYLRCKGASGEVDRADTMAFYRQAK